VQPDSQVEFDSEIALIYSTYYELLQRNQLTEDDNDQLRALAALQGEIDVARSIFHGSLMLTC
jgi:hypothetical protein